MLFECKTSKPNFYPLMAEPTCVMPSFPCSPQQENENPMNGLGDSISFGKYMTEDLSWERWSTFHVNNNRKRYVEEAEKYSRPGSVAQKKAYFEARFKRVASLKAASLDPEDGVQECAEFKGDVEFCSYGQNSVNDSVDERVQKENDEKDKVSMIGKHDNVEKVDVKHVSEEEKDDPAKENAMKDQAEKNLATAKDENCNGIKKDSSRATQMATPSPLQVSINDIAESSPSNANLAKRGDTSHLDSIEPRQNNLSSESKPAKTGRNKASSPINPSCFCWSRRDRSARRKQEKAETRHNKFRLSFCFKSHAVN